VIYLILSIVFGVIAVAGLLGAWLKRPKRVVLSWLAISAAIAAGAAYTESFWPVPAFGLMVAWAGIGALKTMSLAWRMKTGFTVYVALGAMFALYPTIHDEIMCPDVPKEQVHTLRSTCPEVVDNMDAEPREALLEAALVGDKGITQFLLYNMDFRMVRGLDLKGGLRLVYTVDVDEAIKDARDRNYDDLRAALTKSYGFVEGEQATVEEMQKLKAVLSMGKPRDKTSTVTVSFKEPADSKKHINDKLLVPFLREMSILRSADGKEVTLQIRNDTETYIRERAVNQARETILRRVDGMGVKEAAVSVRDEDIIVEIPGSKESEFTQIRDIISETARLEFKMLDDEANFFEPYASSEQVPEGIAFDIENAPIGPGKTQPNYYARLQKKKGESMEEALTRFKEWADTLPMVDQDHEIGFSKFYRVNEDTEEYEAVGWRTYYLRGKAELTGDMVRDAQALSDQSDTGFGAWYVNMTLTPGGAQQFEDITAANVKRRFAIVLDGKVESAPEIREKIGGGQARITMGAGGVQQQLKDARKLELVLRSGALPAPISPSNEQRLRASLGEDAIGQGMQAAAVGGLLVLVLMVFSYKKVGLIANLAVCFNLLLQISVLAMFGASMTLPGIAGLALTVGMAVDANVLINERIKEELASGKSSRAAVSVGYDKAFSAIIDGNATTLISALILAQYGSGPIKGFAVTLIIGMLTNLFTGVVVTRLIFEFWVRGRRDTKLSMA
jgi:preprotein translocase subunit SecD